MNFISSLSRGLPRPSGSCLFSQLENGDQHGLKVELGEVLGMGQLEDVSRPAAGSGNVCGGDAGFSLR